MPRRYSRTPKTGRRQPVWFDRIIDFTLAGNGTILKNLDSNIVQSVKKGLTVVRILMDLMIMPQGTGTGGTLSAGIAMMHGDAKSAGANADPAEEDEAAGYLWRWAGHGSIRQRCA